MTRKKSKGRGQGTFAQLYDVQEELSQRNSKPLGRPRKKVQRKPTTIHLTAAEGRNLSKLHLQINEYFSINRSELTGVAIDVLVMLVENRGEELFEEGQIQNLEAFRRAVSDFVTL